jgi:hypothetical protein
LKMTELKLLILTFILLKRMVVKEKLKRKLIF